MSLELFVPRSELLANAKQLRTQLDRFRNGTRVDLAELSVQLTKQSQALAERIVKDDLLLADGLSQMTYLDDLGDARFDGLADQFSFTEEAPEGEDNQVVGNIQLEEERLALPTLQQIRDALRVILDVFDLDADEPTSEESTQSQRVFADLFNGFRGSELDPLRSQLGGIVDFSVPPTEPSSAERGVRELGRLLTDTLETRIQFALIDTAAKTLNAFCRRIEVLCRQQLLMNS